MNPIAQTWRGIHGFLAGLKWLRNHKKHLFLLMVPIALGFGAASGALTFFATNSDRIFGWILPAVPEAWYWYGLYFIAKTFLWFAVLLTCFIVALLVVSVVSAPLYEIVSIAIERDVTGGPVQELSFKASVRMIGEELKKVVFIICITILLLFIPGLNVLSTLIAAFLIGWDFYDFPRGWTFRQRFNFVLKDFWAVMGLGFWLVIPFVNIVLMPLAVAGGTLLNLEELKKRDLLPIKET